MSRENATSMLHNAIEIENADEPFEYLLDVDVEEESDLQNCAPPPPPPPLPTVRAVPKRRRSSSRRKSKKLPPSYRARMISGADPPAADGSSVRIDNDIFRGTSEDQSSPPQVSLRQHIEHQQSHDDEETSRGEGVTLREETLLLEEKMAQLEESLQQTSQQPFTDDDFHGYLNYCENPDDPTISTTTYGTSSQLASLVETFSEPLPSLADTHVSSITDGSHNSHSRSNNGERKNNHYAAGSGRSDNFNNRHHNKEDEEPKSFYWDRLNRSEENLHQRHPHQQGTGNPISGEVNRVNNDGNQQLTSYDMRQQLHMLKEEISQMNENDIAHGKDEDSVEIAYIDKSSSIINNKKYKEKLYLLTDLLEAVEKHHEQEKLQWEEEKQQYQDERQVFEELKTHWETYGGDPDSSSNEDPPETQMQQKKTGQEPLSSREAQLTQENRVLESQLTNVKSQVDHMKALHEKAKAENAANRGVLPDAEFFAELEHYKKESDLYLRKSRQLEQEKESLLKEKQSLQSQLQEVMELTNEKDELISELNSVQHLQKLKESSSLSGTCSTSRNSRSTNTEMMERQLESLSREYDEYTQQTEFQLSNIEKQYKQEKFNMQDELENARQEVIHCRKQLEIKEKQYRQETRLLETQKGTLQSKLEAAQDENIQLQQTVDNYEHKHKQEKRTLEAQLNLIKQEKRTAQSRFEKQLKSLEDKYKGLQEQYECKDQQKQTYQTQYNHMKLELQKARENHKKQYQLRQQQDLQSKEEEKCHDEFVEIMQVDSSENDIIISQQQTQIELLQHECAQYKDEIQSTKQDFRALEALLNSVQEEVEQVQKQAEDERGRIEEQCKNQQQKIEMLQNQISDKEEQCQEEKDSLLDQQVLSRANTMTSIQQQSQFELVQKECRAHEEELRKTQELLESKQMECATYQQEMERISDQFESLKREGYEYYLQSKSEKEEIENQCTPRDDPISKQQMRSSKGKLDLQQRQEEDTELSTIRKKCDQYQLRVRELEDKVSSREMEFLEEKGKLDSQLRSIEKEHAALQKQQEETKDLEKTVKQMEETIKQLENDKIRVEEGKPSQAKTKSNPATMEWLDKQRKMEKKRRETQFSKKEQDYENQISAMETKYEQIQNDLAECKQKHEREKKELESKLSKDRDSGKNNLPKISQNSGIVRQLQQLREQYNKEKKEWESLKKSMRRGGGGGMSIGGVSSSAGIVSGSAGQNSKNRHSLPNQTNKIQHHIQEHENEIKELKDRHAEEKMEWAKEQNQVLEEVKNQHEQEKKELKKKIDSITKSNGSAINDNSKDSKNTARKESQDRQDSKNIKQLEHQVQLWKKEKKEWEVQLESLKAETDTYRRSAEKSLDLERQLNKLKIRYEKEKQEWEEKLESFQTPTKRGGTRLGMFRTGRVGGKGAANKVGGGDELKEIKATHNKEIEDWEKRVKLLQLDYENYRQQQMEVIKDWEDKVTKLQQEKKDIQLFQTEENNRYDQEIKEWDEKVKSLEKEYQSCRQQRMEEVEQWEGKVNMLKEENEKIQCLRKEHESQYLEEIKDLNEKVQSLQSERDNARQYRDKDCAELETQLHESNRSILELQHQLKDLEDQHKCETSEMESRLLSVKQMCNKYRAAAEEADREKMEHKKQLNEQKVESVNHLKDQILELQNQLEEERANWKSQLENASASHKEFNDRLLQLCEDHKKERFEMESMIASLQEENNQCRKELESEIEKLQHRLTEERKELERKIELAEVAIAQANDRATDLESEHEKENTRYLEEKNQLSIAKISLENQLQFVQSQLEKERRECKEESMKMEQNKNELLSSSFEELKREMQFMGQQQKEWMENISQRDERLKEDLAKTLQKGTKEVIASTLKATEEDDQLLLKSSNPISEDEETDAAEISKNRSSLKDNNRPSVEVRQKQFVGGRGMQIDLSNQCDSNRKIAIEVSDESSHLIAEFQAELEQKQSYLEELRDNLQRKHEELQEMKDDLSIEQRLRQNVEKERKDLKDKLSAYNDEVMRLQTLNLNFEKHIETAATKHGQRKPLSASGIEQLKNPDACKSRNQFNVSTGGHRVASFDSDCDEGGVGFFVDSDINSDGNSDDEAETDDFPMLEQAISLAQCLKQMMSDDQSDQGKESTVIEHLEALSEMMDKADRGELVLASSSSSVGMKSAGDGNNNCDANALTVDTSADCKSHLRQLSAKGAEIAAFFLKDAIYTDDEDDEKNHCRHSFDLRCSSLLSEAMIPSDDERSVDDKRESLDTLNADLVLDQILSDEDPPTTDDSEKDRAHTQDSIESGDQQHEAIEGKLSDDDQWDEGSPNPNQHITLSGEVSYCRGYSIDDEERNFIEVQKSSFEVLSLDNAITNESVLGTINEKEEENKHKLEKKPSKENLLQSQPDFSSGDGRSADEGRRHPCQRQQEEHQEQSLQSQPIPGESSLGAKTNEFLHQNLCKTQSGSTCTNFLTFSDGHVEILQNDTLNYSDVIGDSIEDGAKSLILGESAPNSPLQFIIEQMYGRCKILERERHTFVKLTLDMLETAQESSEAEIEAAVSTIRRRTADEVMQLRKANHEQMQTIWSHLCEKCKRGIGPLCMM